MRGRRGVGVMSPLAGLAVVASLALSGYATRFFWYNQFGVVVLATPTSLSAEMETALGHCRITPEALAAAGVTGPETATLVGNTIEWWVEHSESWDDTLQSASVHASMLGRIEGRVRAGVASSEELESLAECRADCAAAKATHQAILDGLWDSATDGLDSGKTERLATVRANLDAKRDLPVKYLVLAWSPADATNLRRALHSVAEAARAGETADTASQQLVNTANGATAVVEAATRLSLYLADVQAAWSASVE